MTRNLCRSVPILFALATLTAFAQAPAGAPPAGAPQQRRPIPNPTNLKVLPKDMTGQQVVAIMRQWEGDLGVECSYCHAKDPATGRNNFASDENPLKDTARLMLKMNIALNKEYISQVTPKTDASVHCGTCHRGMPKPTVFVPPAHERPAGAPPSAASPK